ENKSDIAYANVIDHYRLHYTWLLLATFSAALIAFAGWTGLKALISFFFSGVTILKLLLPAILHGFDPLWTTFALVVVIAFVTIFLVGGFSRRGLVSFLGALGGIVLTILLGSVLTGLFKIHGAVTPFTETLLYSGFDFLDLTGLFIAGIFLASSGAVMDLSINVSAAMAEIVETSPTISRGALIKSGFSVGRHVFGTMITTLLLAYTGGYTSLIMIFIAQGIPFENIINMIYVSAEFVHTMVGSFGMILVAPVTALVGGVFFIKRKTEAAAAPKSRLIA
ncbi:MAG: YibE/F family protein, partial [Deltaproteobacteria bacterium]|nr:YibE/F family protein [Deltaproteobacteria bacterium]